MKEITAYKTFDEFIFEDKDQAERHEKLSDLREWYYNNKLYRKLDKVIQIIKDNIHEYKKK